MRHPTREYKMHNDPKEKVAGDAAALLIPMYGAVILIIAEIVNATMSKIKYHKYSPKDDRRYISKNHPVGLKTSGSDIPVSID